MLWTTVVLLATIFVVVFTFQNIGSSIVFGRLSSSSSLPMGAGIQEAKVGGAADEWFDRTVVRISRAWPRKKDMDWCIIIKDEEGAKGREDAAEDRDQAPLSGLLFVKNYKAASSTGASITARVAYTAGREISGNQSNSSFHCDYHASHDFADSGSLKVKRNTRQSFLWTIVRHPTERVMSGFAYFRAGPRQATTDANIIAYGESERSAQVQMLDTTSVVTAGRVVTDLNRHAATRRIHTSILQAYDFIAVQDRMDESLAVLKLLLDLQNSWDVIVLSSKRVGSWDRSPTGKCLLLKSLPDHAVSPQVRDYLAKNFSDPQRNYDVLLYAAINRSLDMTIDRLGRRVVEEEVERQRRLQQVAHYSCRSEAMFPCSTGGKLQLQAAKESCYQKDWGCGHACLDRMRQQEIP